MALFGSITYGKVCDTIDKNITVKRIVTKSVKYGVCYENIMKKADADFSMSPNAPKWAHYIISNMVLEHNKDASKRYLKITNIANPNYHTTYYVNGVETPYEDAIKLIKPSKKTGETPIVQTISFENILAINGNSVG